MTDFVSTDDDKLSLSGLNADSTLGGIPALIWIDGTAFGNIAGELRWELVGSNLKLLADLIVTQNGVATVTRPDVIL